MNIDELFKTKLQNGSSSLGKNLWKKIDNNFSNGAGQSFFKGLSFTSKVIGGCVATAVIVAISVVILNNNSNNEDIAKTEKTKQIIENTLSSTTIQTTESTTNNYFQEIQNTNLQKNNNELVFDIEDNVVYISKENNYTPTPPQNINNNINSEIIPAPSPQIRENKEEKVVIDSTEQKTKINILIPNYITPNGDEINDCFEIKNIEAFPDNFLIIRDRKGKRVFGQHNYKNDFCGDNCVAGTYFYLLTIRVNNRTQQFSGTLEVIK